MFALNQNILIGLSNRRLVAKLIGIDAYNLENYNGKRCEWLSYTLVTKKIGKYGRFWLTDWKKTGWVLWTNSKLKRPPKGYRMVAERSGIAKIGFTGDSGSSTSHAALAVFSLNDKYYSLERFKTSEVMFFTGIKILKPKQEL